jgi:citrate lyase beta subunit
MVLCLEDSIGDSEVSDAEDNLIEQLYELSAALETGVQDADHLPLLFIRVRSPEHLASMIARIGDLAHLLAGFVLPKFNSANGQAFMNAMATAAPELRLWALPVLESPELMYAEGRVQELVATADILKAHRDVVPCVRLGATDMSGVYGLRRSPDLTIYDIGVVRDAIVDIVNVFGRNGNGWTISGPVWEYFSSEERVLKPQLRESSFAEESGDEGLRLRRQLLAKGLDGLVREVLLDQANGLQGKTIIHPTHVVAVNALAAVSLEEFTDAQTVIAQTQSGLGATGSAARNKMNEPKPHMKWARKVLRRADVYGVLRDEHNYVALLEATTAAQAGSLR